LRHSARQFSSSEIMTGATTFAPICGGLRALSLI
jgi:hypothetical protein